MKEKAQRECMNVDQESSRGIQVGMSYSNRERCSKGYTLDPLGSCLMDMSLVDHVAKKCNQ